ncbi:hypothetical protein KAW55_03045, partial [bacterium]|nr:hypothetical protein [bacterium]
MAKIQIVGHNLAREEVVAELQRLGLMEITDLRETFKDSEYEEFLLKGEDGDERLEKRQLEIESALSYLAQFEKRGPGESFFPARVNLSKDEFLNIIQNFDYARFCQACQKLEQELKEMEANRLKLSRQAVELRPWQRLNIPLEELRETRETKVSLGTVSNRDFGPQGMKERTEEVSREIFIQVIEETKSVKYCLLLYLKEH